MGRLCALVGRAVLGPVQCSLFKIFVPHLVSKKITKNPINIGNLLASGLMSVAAGKFPPTAFAFPSETSLR